MSIVIINGIECDIQEPGLKFDAIASGTPESTIFRAGAYPQFRKKEEPGRTVATVPDCFNRDIPVSSILSR